MTPLVSILIPCYNAARWLPATLESALAQTWPRCEVIVVDDGSTDDSAAVAHSFAPRGVIVASQPNAGASAARNHALRRATGDFIQFLDADDLLAPDKISLQLTALSACPSGTVASAAWGIFSGEPAHARFTREPVWADLPATDWLIRSWSGGGMMHPAAWLAPRAVIERAGPWDERLSLDDDGEYFTRVLLASAGVHFVSTACSFYRSHDGPRLSASSGQRAAASSFLSCELKELALLARLDSPTGRHALACNYQRFAWDQLVTAPDLAHRALARMHALAPDLPAPRGGRLHRLLAPALGWQLARRIELALRPLLAR